MTKLRKGTVFAPCERHAEMYARETRRRRAEVMVEGGWAGSPCTECKMKPGTDIFDAAFVAAYPVFYAGQES